jgi:hypothetical protein
VLSVSEQEFSYLRIQRGDLDHLSHDFRQWLPAYCAKLEETFNMIQPCLPETCESLLDIGSGLGGIDILLSKHYQQASGQKPVVYLLDGDGEPEVTHHNRPFNDRILALGFLYRHGVDAFALIPEYLNSIKVGSFDLIVSFAAWGFHIPVNDYLDYVLEHSHADTTIIVDARRPQAVEEFERYFQVELIDHGKKYDRLVMKKSGGPS